MSRSMCVRAIAFAILIFVSAAALADAPEISAEHVRRVAALMASAKYRAAVSTLEHEHDLTVENIISITEVPAPPFGEVQRARAYMEMLRSHGLTDIEMDAEGNVMGLREGTGDGSLVVMSAHLDTVFPEGTPVKVRREGTRLYAPGVGDDSRGLAVLLAYARALDAAKIRTRHDILFVGTVGEEGRGDLRGVRYFFAHGKYKDRVRYFFSLDGNEPQRVAHAGVGSKRYRVTFKGPGGHSFKAFGIVNPMTAMSEAVVAFYRIKVPSTPRTTYSASVTGGGTSVNAIPNEVFMEFDMRSEDPAELAKLEARLVAAIDVAVARENRARSTREGTVSATRELIGDRPAGSTPRDAALVQYAAAAASAQGYTPAFEASSTDSNVPMSLGIQAVTISPGSGARSHSLEEYIDVDKAESVRAMQVGLTALLAVAEMQ